MIPSWALTSSACWADHGCAALSQPGREGRKELHRASGGILTLPSAVQCALSLGGDTAPVMPTGNVSFSFYPFFLDESILTGKSLTYYVKQVISWLFVLHLAKQLEMYHTWQYSRTDFRRGQLTQKVLLQPYLQYPGSDSCPLLAGRSSRSCCEWLMHLFFLPCKIIICLA